MASAFALTTASATERQAVFGSETASAEAREVANWVVESSDNQGMNFLIVDKTNAKVFVFESNGHLQAAAPALLGLAHGDHSVPGIGERKIADIRPEERTTPAGRFVAEPGRNAQGEDIVWVDYDAAVSMHRVRATNPKEHRLERLASPTAADNRISYGCINLPAAFYEQYVRPALAGGHALIYVLPETRPAREWFGLHATRQLSRAPTLPTSSSRTPRDEP